VRSIKLEDRTYAFDLAYTATGGASLKSVDYAFGDGQGQENVSPEQAKTITHTYAKAGTYTTTATLHFMTADATAMVKDDDCQVTITTSPEVCPLNPTLPKEDSRCTPCPIPGKEQFPKDSPFCAAPPVAELPKTGPMDLIGGGIGISSIVAASYYWFISRRGLLAAHLER
jgi:PKD repeat protein